jgi:hypothetical protein
MKMVEGEEGEDTIEAEDTIEVEGMKNDVRKEGGGILALMFER